jgi:hypothetical protein
MVEAGGSEYSGVLKTRNLLILRPAKNAVYDKIAPNWNVSGTRKKSDFKKNLRRQRHEASDERLDHPAVAGGVSFIPLPSF